jgi:uncharacterized membrane protein YeaQ/YmgE (transglycosylase-associated protein family)
MDMIVRTILGLDAGLLASMPIPGRRSQGLILTCATGVAGALLGGCGRSVRCGHSRSLRLARR